MGLINLTQHTLERIIKNIKDRIQDATPFVGTQNEWNALSASEKAKYKIVHLTGNGTYKRDATTGDLVSIAGSGGSSSPMTGATSSTDGVGGSTPTPLAGDQDKVLQGDGTWGHKLVIDIVENNGVYGYMNGNTFVPFKSQADIDAAVTAARVGNATAADVLSGKTFTNSSTSGVTGTMVNRSSTIVAATTSTSNSNIPCYRTNGSNIEVIPSIGYWGTWDWSKEKITIPVQEKTVTGSRSAQTVTPDSGKYLTKVTVNKYPDASGTYTPSGHGTALDMGATNNYRYVNTTNAYNAGYNANAITSSTTMSGYGGGKQTTSRYYKLIYVKNGSIITTSNYNTYSAGSYLLGVASGTQMAFNGSSSDKTSIVCFY